jgi:hypothetical protein
MKRSTMKKIIFILFLVFPLALFCQTQELTSLHNIFTYKGEELRILIKTHQSMVKINDVEIDAIAKIIDERTEEKSKLIDKIHKSVPVDKNGKPIGKANTEFINQYNAILEEISDSILELLGDKRFRQFRRLIIDDQEKKNAELVKKALEDRNGKK